MNVILLTGMPASGKSSFAAYLRKALSLPILEKDAIKEALFDTIGFQNYAEKRKLDHAANRALLVCAKALLENGQSFAIDNNFDQIAAEAWNDIADTYHCNCITVFFGGDIDVFYARYVARDNAHQRHLGHILQEHYPPSKGESTDYTMTREEFSDKFEKRGMMDFHCSGARIEVDASTAEGIDYVQLLKRIRFFMK